MPPPSKIRGRRGRSSLSSVLFSGLRQPCGLDEQLEELPLSWVFGAQKVALQYQGAEHALSSVNPSSPVIRTCGQLLDHPSAAKFELPRRNRASPSTTLPEADAPTPIRRPGREIWLQWTLETCTSVNERMSPQSPRKGELALPTTPARRLPSSKATVVAVQLPRDDRSGSLCYSPVPPPP